MKETAPEKGKEDSLKRYKLINASLENENDARDEQKRLLM